MTSPENGNVKKTEAHEYLTLPMLLACLMPHLPRFPKFNGSDLHVDVGRAS